MTYSRILGTGHFLPEKVLTNLDMEKLVETSDEWIRTRTGIQQRHIAADDETTCDLAEQAAKRAMDAAGVSPEEIDLIVVGTTTPDQVFPNLGCLLQDRFGIRGCPAFSVEAACSGFVYALSIADKFVRSGDSKRALVVGAETLTRMVDWKDRSTCVLFGDGAGAVVLGPSEETGILATHLHADGKYKDMLYFPGGVSKGFDEWRSGGSFLQMKGNDVFRIAVKTLSRIVVDTLAAADMKADDVDWLVPHQANIRIIEATAKRLKMPMERVVVTVDEHANTSSASVPMALDVAVRDGRIKRGQTVVLEAFGGGFTWGSVLLRY